MKRRFRILPFLLSAIVVASPFYGGQQTGTVTGIVLDSDGKTPLAGATVQIDSLVKLSDGRMALRERVLIKTLRDGRYRYSEVRPGRIRITIIVNNKPVMSYGGDDILVVEGGETVADFDLSKAPPAQ